MFQCALSSPAYNHVTNTTTKPSELWLDMCHVAEPTNQPSNQLIQEAPVEDSDQNYDIHGLTSLELALILTLS